MTRDKEHHFIMIKKSIHQENITILNIYALKASKCMKQKLIIKGELDKLTIIVGDFNNLLSIAIENVH